MMTGDRRDGRINTLKVKATTLNVRLSTDSGATDNFKIQIGKPEPGSKANTPDNEVLRLAEIPDDKTLVRTTLRRKPGVALKVPSTPIVTVTE